MEREDSSGSGLYRPWMGAENRSCDGIAAAAELPSVDECEPIENMDDSQLVGVSGIVSVAGDEEVHAAVDVEVKAEVEVRERSDGKRKRGRPPRGQARPAPSKKKEDEDVCFICFDGGSLVLCDRRGCPKAYHPACIKRDEAFFRSRAKWNCGWHICNSCQKAAHYLCYTCTYSLCKSCTKDADYLCVRENEGFCTTCMRTIMLIENNDQGNKEMAQVDFDDKSSWEYLFKLYWIYLKGKLSLTLDELTQAQNPSKAAGIVVHKGQSLDVHCGGSYGSSISDSPSGHLGANNSKRRRTKEQPKLPNKGVSLRTDKSISDNGNTSVGSTEWASKELLEFAAHMRNGEERRPHKNLDKYAAINVHNINLIYLRRNLMESLMVDNGKFHDKVVGSIVRIRISSSDQKQDMHRLVQVVGTCKVAVPYKIGERTTDVMLEILNLDKKETISIDSISNLQFSEDECRRLRECIKCGLVERLTVGQVQDTAMALQEARFNDWLETEIMRLNHLWDQASEKGHKKELRECVEKLELLKTPKEHQRRLHEIPEVHVDPKVDPNCESDEDAGVISNKKQDEYVKPRSSGFSRNGREPISPRNGDISKESGSRVWKELSTCDQTRSTLHLEEGAPCTVVERMNESSWNEGKNACGSNTLEKSGNQVDSSGSVVGGWNNQAVLRSGSFSGVVSETSVASLSTGSAPSADDSETDKLWHYWDQNGKIQGPFCMVQLRQWNAAGLFPPDMRIWSINDEEGNSLLLTDAVANSNRDNEFVKDDGWGSHSSNWTIPVVNNNDVQTRSSSQCWDSLKVKNSYSDQPQVQCPIPSSAFTERPHETSPHQARGHEDQRWNSALNHGNWSSHGNGISQSTGGQSHENQCNSQGSGQSSGESWRPLPVNYSTNNWDSNSGFASVAKSTDSSELNIGNDIPNLPSTMPKTSNADLEGQTTIYQQLLPSNVHVQDSSIQNMPSVLPKPASENDNIQAIENKQSASSNFAVQDSGLSWSSASSLVVGCGTRLPEIADEWGGAKPSVEERDSGLVSVSSLKPPVVASDHAATPTSKCDKITPSPSHPASSWQIIVAEPIEFSTLAEESVSDLLAEVDAMESQCGLASPTSMMNCGEELFQDSKADCFTSLRELSPPLDSGKSDALSSTGDIQLPPQPTVTDEPLGASQVDIFDPVKRSGGQSSASTEMEVETKPTEVPDNQSEAGSSSQLPAPSTMSQNRIDTDTAPRARAKPGDTGCGTLQGNMKSGRGGSTQGITDVGSGTGQGIARTNSNMDWSASAGFIGRESHIKYGGERFMGPRDRAFQGGDSVFGRGRLSWSRQSSFGAAGGGGGSYSKLPPKGQRECKFYINGHCKKGALCDYLHPS